MLVATCIAEEGLDIDEVDLIVFFESVSSPIRMVQRMGRTGRYVPFPQTKWVIARVTYLS